MHSASNINERFEVFTAVTMKNDVSWDVTPCKSRHFGGTMFLSVLTRATRRNIPENAIFLTEIITRSRKIMFLGSEATAGA
jgi:hypothetical protein